MLLHGDPILSEAEQILWQAFYCLEPYGNYRKALIYIESSLRQVKDPKKLFPIECQMDQPVLDNLKDPEKNKKLIISQLDAMAADYIKSMGLKEFPVQTKDK